MSHIEEVAKDECEMQMTPMIDVVFLLLIFFMCTLKFKTLEGKLAAYLPHDARSDDPKVTQVERIEVVLRQRLDAATGERALAVQIGPREYQELAGVRARLKVLHEAAPERELLIDAREGVEHGEVIAVLDQTLAAGYEAISFAPPRP